MIAACPKCGARYRIDEARLEPQGARVRCARCEAIFRVRAPQPRGRPEHSAAPRPLVIVVDPVAESGRATAQALSALGLEAQLLQDGVEALLEIQRRSPRAVVLDPGATGGRICELMKRNEGFRCVPVVRIGADRPGERFAPEAWVERPDLPRSWAPVLRRLGLEVAAAPEAGPPPRAPAPHPAKPSEDRGALDPAEVAKAQRLARIVVSDIVLYNAAKFEAAVRAGNVIEAMRDELAEGRSLFRQRVDARVRESADFLGEELLRVAAERRRR